LGNLFQKFSRLSETESARRQKGTGLGLFITKNIVEAHGGTIAAASQVGAWTEFTFALPASREAEQGEADGASGKAKKGTSHG
jgi:two-component system sensor histidine kinase ResE